MFSDGKNSLLINYKYFAGYFLQVLKRKRKYERKQSMHYVSNT